MAASRPPLPSNSEPAVFMDSSAKGTIIRYAFAIEASFNLPAIIALAFYPNATLSMYLVSDAQASTLDMTIAILARCLAALILALTPQLLLALPNTHGCVERRRLVYLTLGVGEAALIPLFLAEAFRATDAEKVMGSGGFSQKATLNSVASLAPLLLWRIYVSIWKPQWFGAYEGSSRPKNPKSD